MPTTTLHFPGDDEVHVWCADPSELERNGLIGPAQALLTAEEIERLRRFHFNSDRLIFLATRVLVRQVLSRYETVAPDAWTFLPTLMVDRRLRVQSPSCASICRIPRGSSSVPSPARWTSASMSNRSRGRNPSRTSTISWRPAKRRRCASYGGRAGESVLRLLDAEGELYQGARFGARNPA